MQMTIPPLLVLGYYALAEKGLYIMNKTYSLNIKITSNTGIEVFSADLKELSEETVDQIQRVVMEASLPH